VTQYGYDQNAAKVGRTREAGSKWTWSGDYAGQNCRVESHLYCFSAIEFVAEGGGGGAGRLSLAKQVTANDDADNTRDVSPVDTLTYTFKAINFGKTNLTGVTITDSLPGLSPLKAETSIYTLTAINFFTAFGVKIANPLPGMNALSCTPAQPATLASTESLICKATYTVTDEDAEAGVISHTATADSDQTAAVSDDSNVPVAGGSDDDGFCFISTAAYEAAAATASARIGRLVAAYQNGRSRVACHRRRGAWLLAQRQRFSMKVVPNQTFSRTKETKPVLSIDFEIVYFAY
jgi:uncharacterized repeat protein (TIGR01451 family)